MIKRLFSIIKLFMKYDNERIRTLNLNEINERRFIIK